MEGRQPQSLLGWVPQFHMLHQHQHQPHRDRVNLKLAIGSCWILPTRAIPKVTSWGGGDGGGWTGRLPAPATQVSPAPRGGGRGPRCGGGASRGLHVLVLRARAQLRPLCPPPPNPFVTLRLSERLPLAQ